MSDRRRLDARKRAFIAALANGLSVYEAAKAAGVCRQQPYVWRSKDPAFAAAWDEAVEEATDKLEDEARRRAFAGSDTLLIFLLKARRPHIYRDHVRHEHSGPDGGPIVVITGVDRGEDPPAV